MDSDKSDVTKKKAVESDAAMKKDDTKKNDVEYDRF